MLIREEKTEEKKFALPPKIKSTYKNFKFLSETSTYKVYEAESCYTDEKHTVRILDRSKEFVTKEFGLTATLFVKELLHLQNRCPGSVITNTFEISENGQLLACATLPYLTLSCQINEEREILNPKDPQMIEKLISNALDDVEFLWEKLQIRNVMSTLGSDNLCFLKGKGAFFLSDWAKIFESGTDNLLLSVVPSKTSSLKGAKLTSLELAGEIKNLAMTVLKLNKANFKEIEHLRQREDVSSEIYNTIVTSTLEKCFSNCKKLQDLIGKMLSLKPQNLPTLEELRFKERRLPKLGFEEANDSTLLAWCLNETNKVNVIELDTKQHYASFDGAQNNEGHWAHVKEIPNTKLLVSLYHHRSRSTNLEIFDISKKEQAVKIYSLEEVVGSNIPFNDSMNCIIAVVTGYGDVTTNMRRSILGAISLQDKIAYHLLTIDAASFKNDEIVKLSRKSQWHPQYSNGSENCITGLDFNPNGESIATIDRYGICLIADVNTDNYRFSLELGGAKNYIGRCRWSTNADEPLLFVKFGYNKLNVLDTEKKVLTLTMPILLEKAFDPTNWIDVCQNNGNLLATGGFDKTIKIFDKREAKVVGTFSGFHSDAINCVRWNSNGGLLASSSNDKSANMLDFRTGKILHAISENRPIDSICFM